MVIELAPSLAVMIFGVVPTAVGIALAAPGEIVVVPIVAAVSTGSVGIFVVFELQQLAQHALCDRCEGAARCTTPGGSAMR